MKHSASRALALLKAMNRQSVSCVAELSQATGISKPSVVRLLAILKDDGFVERASPRGTYRLTRDVLLLSSGFRHETGIVRVAAPIMEELTASIEWPTALGLFEQGSMVIHYSTIPSSPLAWYRTTLFLKLALLGSAMGQIYLANMDVETRRSLLEACDDAETTLGPISDEFFDRVKNRRYGLRTPSKDHPTFSISVPIMVDGSVAAALSVTIYAKAMSVDDALSRYLEPLEVAARRIGASALAH